MEMKMRGATELKNWILSFSPWIEVLEPPGLRSEVARILRTGANLYRGKCRRPTRPAPRGRNTRKGPR